VSHEHGRDWGKNIQSLVIYTRLKQSWKLHSFKIGKVKNFKQLKIWQKGIDIAIKSFALTKTFPKEEKFGLCTQINNAATSIPSNIAEGSSRRSEKDYNRFIEIALGSAFEMETQLLIAQAVKYGDPKLLSEILHDLDEEEKMLISFAGKLQK
jgi:four helix bundle protein